MARTLNVEEIEIYVKNRDALHSELSELQADYEDMLDEDLLDCRETIANRINRCLELILETDEDNII